jgi:hypothetical protein
MPNLDALARLVFWPESLFEWACVADPYLIPQ